MTVGRRFQVRLSLKTLETSPQSSESTNFVHFKVDGGRFSDKQTIKLNTKTTYVLEITLTPDQQLQGCTIYGSTYDVQAMTTVLKDDDVMAYSVNWSTEDVEVTRPGSRLDIPIILKLAEVPQVVINLQCKVYPQGERDHSHWGTVIHAIDYECQQAEGAQSVEVVTRTFR